MPLCRSHIHRIRLGLHPPVWWCHAWLEMNRESIIWQYVPHGHVRLHQYASGTEDNSPWLSCRDPTQIGSGDCSNQRRTDNLLHARVGSDQNTSSRIVEIRLWRHSNMDLTAFKKRVPLFYHNLLADIILMMNIACFWKAIFQIDIESITFIDSNNGNSTVIKQSISGCFAFQKGTLTCFCFQNQVLSI